MLILNFLSTFLRIYTHRSPRFFSYPRTNRRRKTDLPSIDFSTNILSSIIFIIARREKRSSINRFQRLLSLNSTCYAHSQTLVESSTSSQSQSNDIHVQPFHHGSMRRGEREKKSVWTKRSAFETGTTFAGRTISSNRCRD